MLLKRMLILVLMAVSVLSVLTARPNLLAESAALLQYGGGQVAIWTDKGGQGQQYGGSYTIGETVTLFFQSSLDGYAVVAVCYGGMSNCSEIDETQVAAYQIYSIQNTVGAPSGQYYFLLQVCPSGVQPSATYTTPVVPASPPENQAYRFSPQQSSCPGNYTWIDVTGGLADIYITNCWVTPPNPLQEDQVTFFASIGNSGGADAKNVLIQAYLDGNLFTSERDNLPAGYSSTWSSNTPYTAQDGPHTLRVIANSDHSIPESDYSNDEASCTFYVSPHTITATMTQTTTSTFIQSQWTTTTSTIDQYTTKDTTSQTTIQSTVTANPVLTSTTTTGLSYVTIYSPVITTTVTVAQAISNPISLVAPLILLAGLVAKQENLVETSRIEDFLRLCLRALRSKRSRRILNSLLLITVSLGAIMTMAVKPGYASTITLTSIRSQTLFTTLTTSFTSTRYTTSSITDTSTFTNTNVQYTTTTPTDTITVNSGSTSTVYAPTTLTSYTTPSSAGPISIDVEILDPTCSYAVTDITKGQIYCVEVVVNNPTGQSAQITISGAIQFNGDPNQQVGDTWGGSWNIAAQPPSQQFQPQMVSLASGQTSSQAILYRNLYLTWNWIQPVGSNSPVSTVRDWFWSLIWNIVDILLSVGNGIFGLLWGINDLGQEIDTTVRAALARSFTESWNLDVSASISGQTTSVAKEIVAYVADQMVEGLVLSIITAIVAVIGAVVSMVAAIAAACAISFGTACWALFAASAVLGWTAWAAGSAEYEAATDPNGNYTTVPTPNIFIPPTIEALSEGPAKDAATASLRYYAYIRAFSDSLTRYYAAGLNGAQDAAFNQVSAAQEYLAQATAEFQQVRSSYASLNLQPINRTSFGQGLEVLRRNPLPQLQSLFSELGQPNFQQLLLSTADNVTALIPENQSVTINHLLSSASQSLASENTAIATLKGSLPAQTASPLISLGAYSSYVLIALVAVAGVGAFYARKRLSKIGKKNVGKWWQQPSVSKTQATGTATGSTVSPPAPSGTKWYNQGKQEEKKEPWWRNGKKSD